MTNKFLNPRIYISFATSKALTALSPLIGKWEQPFMEEFGNQPLKHQPVFIIAAPRTGSTILYQTLTNLYDVLYINNLVCRLHRNFFFGFWLSDKLYKNKPHNNFVADHGSTKGLHSPCECGQFWYRWLPKDHHFIDYDEITTQMVEEIRREITAVINFFDKPVIFKNLNAGQRLRLLTRSFPDAKYIFLVRDQMYTVQAILAAKRQINIKDNEFWSIMPPNFQELQHLDWDEQIVKQVYFLEKQIMKDSSLVKENNFYSIHYNDLSLQYIDELATHLKFKKKDGAQKPQIRIQEGIFVVPGEFARLQAQIKGLDWGFFPKQFQPSLAHPIERIKGHE